MSTPKRTNDDVSEMAKQLADLAKLIRSVGNTMAKQTGILLSKTLELQEVVSNLAADIVSDSSESENHRKRLLSSEDIERFYQLHKAGNSISKIAKRMKCGEKNINNMIICHSYPKQLRDMIDNREIAMYTLIKFVQNTDMETALRTLPNILEWAKEQNSLRKNDNWITDGVMKLYRKRTV